MLMPTRSPVRLFRLSLGRTCGLSTPEILGRPRESKLELPVLRRFLLEPSKRSSANWQPGWTAASDHHPSRRG
jgi:hypothetical protein